MAKPGSSTSSSNSKIYITQTFQKRYTPFMATLKPLLKYITTIDFGTLTYEKDLDSILRKAKMKIVENSIISGSIDTSLQAARVIVLDPFATVEDVGNMENLCCNSTGQYTKKIA